MSRKKMSAAKPKGAATVRAAGERQGRLTKVATAAVSCAVAAVVIAAGLGITTATTLSTVQGDMVGVLVATDDIARGSVIEQGASVAVKDVPGAYVPSGAIRASEAGGVSGHLAASPITKGSILTSADVSAISASSSLANAIAGSNVAITISSDAEIGLSGLLHPGDVVDVIGKESGGEVAGGLVVLALGSSLSDNPGEYASVTLQASSADAAAISQTEASEGVRLVLRAASSETGVR